MNQTTNQAPDEATTTLPILLTHHTYKLLKARCPELAPGMTYSRWIAGAVDEWAEQMWPLRALLCTPNHPGHWWPHASPSRGKRVTLTLPTATCARLDELARFAGNLKRADMCWTAILSGIAEQGWDVDRKADTHSVHINLSPHEAELFEALGDGVAGRTRAYTRAMRAWLMSRQSGGQATYAAHRRGADNVRVALRLDPTLFVLVRELATIDEVQPAQAFYTIFRHACGLTVPDLPGATAPQHAPEPLPAPPRPRPAEPVPRFESTLKGVMIPVRSPTP
jgi:hypothetical protein